MSSTSSLAATARTISRSTRKLSSGFPSLYTPKSFRSPLTSANHATRHYHGTTIRRAASAEASNPAMAFPCLDALESRSATLEAKTMTSGPEPTYTSGATLRYHCDKPLLLDWGGILPNFDIAYETWGELNADRSNVVLVHTGLSASSHAHSSDINPKPGWWEKIIGPGSYLDTNKYFIVCTNVIGGCYGSTGPGSVDPADGKRYATRFPILTMEDMVRAQFRLLDHLGIKELYASVGASMGGMQSVAAGVLFPERVNRIASISGCARSHPYSMALRHTQRQVLMMDPNWSRGFYYDKVPPHIGMKLAREIATITYRSGTEWENRFGRRRADASKPPALCPDYLIETYLDHQGEKFCLEFDANSLLYISKAMDMFDLGATHQQAASKRRAEKAAQQKAGRPPPDMNAARCSLTPPDTPYEEQADTSATLDMSAPTITSTTPPADLVAGLKGLKDHPVLVMGVTSDILFPAWQQREMAATLRLGGNQKVVHVELGEDVSLFGHDTFLLDAVNIGGNLKRFLQ